MTQRTEQEKEGRAERVLMWAFAYFMFVATTFIALMMIAIAFGWEGLT